MLARRRQQTFTHWRDCTLQFLQKAVGGYIESVPHFETFDLDDAGGGGVVPCVTYCNEEGKLKDLPENWFVTRMWNAALIRAPARRAQRCQTILPAIAG